MATKKKPATVTTEAKKTEEVIRPVTRKDLKTSAERIAFDAKMYPEKHLKRK